MWYAVIMSFSVVTQPSVPSQHIDASDLTQLCLPVCLQQADDVLLPDLAGIDIAQ